MASFFSNMFGGGSNPTPSAGGGVAHNAQGKVMTPANPDPRQQLTNGQGQNQQESQRPAEVVDPVNSRLEDIGMVWNTAKTADGKPVTPQADPLRAQMFNFKDEDVRAGAAKLDFTADLNPELAQKALGGDAAALMELLNGTVRNAFALSTINTGKLMNQGFQQHATNLDSALPDRLKRHQLLSAESENPVLKHASVKPMITAMKLQIAQNHPQLTPAQVQEAAEQYVIGLSGALTENSEQAVTRKEAAKETNWMKYVGLEE